MKTMGALRVPRAKRLDVAVDPFATIGSTGVGVKPGRDALGGALSGGCIGVGRGLFAGVIRPEEEGAMLGYECDAGVTIQ